MSDIYEQYDAMLKEADGLQTRLAATKELLEEWVQKHNDALEKLAKRPTWNADVRAAEAERDASQSEVVESLKTIGDRLDLPHNCDREDIAEAYEREIAAVLDKLKESAKRPSNNVTKM